MPNMDRFASEAVVFDNAYAGSFPTLPCRRDLFTGRWGHPFNTWNRMERDPPTLAGRLRADGYTTGLVFDGTNTNPAQRGGVARGPMGRTARRCVSGSAFILHHCYGNYIIGYLLQCF